MIVKVCGLTPKTDLEALAKLKVDWGGLIFVSDSPRYVGKNVFHLPQNLRPIGVFRDETFRVIASTAQLWSLRTVQLHGSETPEACAELQKEGLSVIKAISVDLSTNIDELTSPYAQHVDYFLFDSPGGGTGRSFDWNKLYSYTHEVPFLLAGGIGPGFGKSLKEIRHSQYKGIDLNSRFELAPGHKDISLLEKFITHELSR